MPKTTGLRRVVRLGVRVFASAVVAGAATTAASTWAQTHKGACRGSDDTANLPPGLVPPN
jgi:hypothetical protein